MVATVSTETLKPTSSEKKSKKDVKLNQDNNNTEAQSSKDVGSPTFLMMGKRVKRGSSSSETESASSGDDTSTDTG